MNGSPFDAFERGLYDQPVAWYCDLTERERYLLHVKGASATNGLLITVALYRPPPNAQPARISITLYDSGGDFVLNAGFALDAYDRALVFLAELVRDQLLIEVHGPDSTAVLMPSARALYERLT